MAENNFALIVVGIVAVVAIVGILNFNNTTGKVVTDETSDTIILEDSSMAWCSEEVCKTTNNVASCKFISTDIGKSCSRIFVSDLGYTYRGYYKP